MLYTINIAYSRAITVRRALKWINIASITNTIIVILSMAIILWHAISILTPIVGLSLCLSNTFGFIVYHFVFVMHTNVACSHIEGQVNVVQDGCRAATRVATVIVAYVDICLKDQRKQKEISKFSTC